MSSKKNNRLDKIIKMLMAQNGITVHEFSENLDVSEITIRRDLQALESAGKVRLINGVAIYCSSRTERPIYPAYNLEYECTVFQKKKERIGKKAASLIAENDIIALDCGSTTEYLAQNLPDDRRFTILTGSMNVLRHASGHPDCSVICTGGYLHPSTQLFSSPEGISLIRHTSINKAFFSASSIADNLNATCIAAYEVDYKSAVLAKSQQNILLVDSSKFGKSFFRSFARLSDFDVVITDDELSPKWRDQIQEAGLTLYLV